MTQPDPAKRKRALRAQFRVSRQGLNARIRADYDRQIRHHIIAHFTGQSGLNLGAYLAFDGEPDLEPALSELRDNGFRIALPVLGVSAPQSMTLRTWTKKTPLKRNRFGIREPADGKPVSLDDLDVLLMPLVAYDTGGVRLGMGGGYYDHLLSARSAGAGPHRVGVAYSRQWAPALPREAWDVPMNALLNEYGWFSFPL